MKKTKMKRPSTDILPPEIPNPFPNQFPTNNYILIRVLLQQDLLLGCTEQKKWFGNGESSVWDTLEIQKP